MEDIDSFLNRLLRGDRSVGRTDVLLKTYIVYHVGQRFAHMMEERAQYAAVGNVPDREEWLGRAFCAYMEQFVVEFADLMTQALLSRRKKINRQSMNEIVKEALLFASFYTNWDSAGKWLALASGLTAEQTDKVDGFPRLVFERPIREASTRWAQQAEARVIFRSLLSRRPAERLKPMDRVKLQIAELKRMNPGISQRALCGKLDAVNDRAGDEVVPVPNTWRREGERSWAGAYNSPTLLVRVKRYLSGVKPLSG